MRILFGAIAAITLLTACSDEPGSQAWCQQKKDQPKSEWTGDDAMTFARHCVFDGSSVGSEEWCASLDEKDKGDWSANEAADYAKYCVF